MMDVAVSEVKVETTGKPYHLRKLQARDLIPFAKIVGKIGIDEIFTCYADEDFTELIMKLKKRREQTRETLNSGVAEFSGEGEKETEEKRDTDFFIVGAAAATRVANKILLNLECCMEEVFAFLGGLSGLSKDEVSELNLEIFLQMLVDIFTENDLVNFIRAAKKFIE